MIPIYCLLEMRHSFVIYMPGYVKVFCLQFFISKQYAGNLNVSTLSVLVLFLSIVLSLN